MPRESKFAKLERERGKPIREILVDALNETQSIESAAVAMGMTYRHVKRKVDELGITKNIHWAARGMEHAE